MGSHATEKAHKWGGDNVADGAGANDRASRKRKREKNIGPDSVGIVKLGLWTGQELLGASKWTDTLALWELC